MQDEEAILYDIVLKRTKRAVIAITGKNRVERMLMHLGDRKDHNSTTAMERLDEFQITVLSHPPHSRDISSCAFFPFGRNKYAMRGQSFQAPEVV
jgi:hypothetical protein